MGVAPTLNGANKKENDMRDTQRSKLYRWEQQLKLAYAEYGGGHNSHCGWVSHLTKKGAERFLARVSDEIKVPLFPCKIVHNPNKKHSCTYKPDKSEIHLAWPWGYNRQVVLHEYTHHLIHNLAKIRKSYQDVASHGPEFVGLYIYLMHRFQKRSFKNMVKMALDDGLKIDIKPIAHLTGKEEYERLRATLVV